jgi:hypothetical protein
MKTTSKSTLSSVLLLVTLAVIATVAILSTKHLWHKEPLEQKAPMTQAASSTELYRYKNSQYGFSMLIPHIGPDGELVEVKEMDARSGVALQYSRKSDGYVWKWEMNIATVTNESELKAFIDAHYGSEKMLANGVCKIEALKPTTDARTVDVVLSGQGAYDGDTSCGNGSVTHIKYSPELKRAVLWSAGQDVGFYTNRNGQEHSYEDEMAASFRFE